MSTFGMLSHFTLGSSEFPFHHVFSDADPGEAPVPWLELGRKCCHFFGIVQTSFRIVFLGPFDVVEHVNEYDSGVCPFTYF